MFHAMTQTLLCMRWCFAGVLLRRSPCLWRTRNITPARNIAKPCARSPTSACERARGLARSKRLIRNEFTHQKRNSKKSAEALLGDWKRKGVGSTMQPNVATRRRRRISSVKGDECRFCTQKTIVYQTSHMQHAISSGKNRMKPH